MVDHIRNIHKSYLLAFYFTVAALLIAAYFTRPFIELNYSDNTYAEIEVANATNSNMRTVYSALLNKIKLNDPEFSFILVEKNGKIYLRLKINYNIRGHLGLNELCIKVYILNYLDDEFCYKKIDVPVILNDVEEFINNGIHQYGLENIAKLEKAANSFPLLTRNMKNKLDANLAQLKEETKAITVNVELGDEKNIIELVSKVNQALKISVIVIFSVLVLIAISVPFNIPFRFKILYELLTWFILLVLVGICIAVIVIVNKKSIVTNDKRIELGLGLATYLFVVGSGIFLIMKFLPLKSLSAPTSKIIKRKF